MGDDAEFYIDEDTDYQAAYEWKAYPVKKIAPYSKAVVAFIAPGAVLIGAAVTDASQRGSDITSAEWVTAAVACIITSAAVFRTSNRGA